MNVHFTDTALAHLDGIYSYIAQDSVRYAQRVIEPITQKAASAAKMPAAATIVPEYSRPDVREVFLYQYRIVYRILPDRIDVLAVVHGARPLPPRLDAID